MAKKNNLLRELPLFYLYRNRIGLLQDRFPLRSYYDLILTG